MLDQIQANPLIWLAGAIVAIMVFLGGVWAMFFGDRTIPQMWQERGWLSVNLRLIAWFFLLFVVLTLLMQITFMRSIASGPSGKSLATLAFIAILGAVLAVGLWRLIAPLSQSPNKQEAGSASIHFKLVSGTSYGPKDTTTGKVKPALILWLQANNTSEDKTTVLLKSVRLVTENGKAYHAKKPEWDDTPSIKVLDKMYPLRPDDDLFHKLNNPIEIGIPLYGHLILLFSQIASLKELDALALGGSVVIDYEDGFGRKGVFAAGPLVVKDGFELPSLPGVNFPKDKEP